MTSVSLPLHDTENDVGAIASKNVDASWLRPASVRVYLFLAVLAIHAAVFGAFLLTMGGEESTPMQDIEVAVVPQGESVTEVSSVEAPQTAPMESPDPPVDSAPQIAEKDDPDVTKPVEAVVPPPEAAPLLSAPPPKIEVAEAPPIAIAKPDEQKTAKPQPDQSEKILQLKRKKERELAERRAMRALRIAQEKAHAKQRAAEFSQGSEARRVGVTHGSEQATQMSKASYANIVSQELNRHKEAQTERGRVGLVLTVGASGAIVSHSIQSSGSSVLDAAVRRMVAETHLPPPPGGSFRGALGVNFK